MKTLGQRLRQRRVAELGLTLQAIADRTEVGAMYISDIERGRRVPLKTAFLELLARAYELPFSEVEYLAMVSRDSVQLDTAGDDSRRKAAAVALARAWADLTQEQLEELRKFAEEGRNGSD